MFLFYLNFILIMQMQIFHYMMSIFDIKQKSYLFMTSILDINTSKVK